MAAKRTGAAAAHHIPQEVFLANAALWFAGFLRKKGEGGERAAPLSFLTYNADGGSD